MRRENNGRLLITVSSAGIERIQAIGRAWDAHTGAHLFDRLRVELKALDAAARGYSGANEFGGNDGLH